MAGQVQKPITAQNGHPIAQSTLNSKAYITAQYIEDNKFF